MSGATRPMRVVATAGHVDHGKSTLLRALTGMEPDRWREERERGLTIDLGFVWTELQVPDTTSTMEVAFVDVPGHQRFIGNMLAGAGAVETVLFVVAADDGWSAQSQEHLEILDVLGTSAAAVAVTKSEAAGTERTREVVDDVATRIAGTSLAGAPIVATDALAGRGLEELAGTLARRLSAAPVPADVGRPRLWVDRAFTIAGAGTVVTGTLAGGQLRVGQRVTLLPAGDEHRVRALQSLGSAIEVALPGSRVAVNLAGLDHEEVARGHAVVGGIPSETPWATTTEVDAWVVALPDRAVETGTTVHVHVGSAETTARALSLLNEDVRADAPGYVRLVLDRPLPLQAGDRLVLRDAGRRVTAAGGTVIDPDPPGRVRGVTARLARAEQLDRIRAAGDADLAVALTEAHGGARRLRSLRAAAPAGLDLGRGLAEVGPFVVTSATLDRWATAVAEALQAHHASEPESPGLTRAALAAVTEAAGAPSEAARALPDHLVARGDLRRAASAYALASFAPARDEATAGRREAILAALLADPLSTPALDEVVRSVGASFEEVNALRSRGDVVVCGKVAFARSAVATAVAALASELDDPSSFTASEARAIWGTSRKYAIPLLEYLDGAGVTSFDGQHRRLLRQAL